jgi:hypothetical protein
MVNSSPKSGRRFTRADAAIDPKFFVRFVDMANEMASVQVCKRRMAALLQPRVGQRILDLGSGTATMHGRSRASSRPAAKTWASITAR